MNDLSDKLKKIKQTAQTHTLTPEEAREICTVFGLDLTEFRECYQASDEKPEWCAYWRMRLANSSNTRIRASIAERKAA